jgi:N-acetylmuramoyl-L-alanine amidase
MVTRQGLSRRRFLVSTAGAAIAFATAGPVMHNASARSTDRLRVTVNGARLRSGPGTTYWILASLSAGTIVQYLENGGSANGYTWYKVKVDSTGKIGYMASTLLGPLSTGPFAVGDVVHVAVAGGGANLRRYPNITSQVLAVVSNGKSGTVIDGPVSDATYTWYQVNFGDAQGWMATVVLSSGPGSDRQWVTVASGPLRARKNPGLSGAVIGSLPVGARGYVTTSMPQEADGYVWVNVQFDNGIRGWVAKNFLTFV